MEETYQKISRGNWIPHESAVNSKDTLKVGAILRIAEATEAMAKNHVKLQAEYDWMRRSRNRYRDDLETERRRCAALKGHITRLKKLTSKT